MFEVLAVLWENDKKIEILKNGKGEILEKTEHIYSENNLLIAKQSFIYNKKGIGYLDFKVTFGKNGKELEKFIKKGNKYLIYEYTYDEKGNLTSKIEKYEKSKIIKSIHEYKYDEFDRLLREVIRDKNGNILDIIYETFYEYGPGGKKKIKIRRWKEGGEFLIVKYNEKEEEIFKISIDTNNFDVWIREYEYYDL